MPFVFVVLSRRIRSVRLPSGPVHATGRLTSDPSTEIALHSTHHSLSLGSRLCARSLLLALFAPLVLASCNDSSAPADTDPVVVTDLGPVRGVVRSGAKEFRGMPYAEAPVNARRWAVPVPAAPWTGTRDGSEFGSACPQEARFNLTERSEDENCLSVNVSVPADIQPGEKLPVFFWLHGGAFVGGASNLYRLDQMAVKGRMVVVSANYRLGVFGFMPHPAFGPNDGFNGNYGLEDQREAMRWAKRNVAAFGGDPENITIAGESAGAGSICVHLANPEKVSGYFHKAALTSAACLQPMTPVEDALKVGTGISDAINCKGTNDEVLTCMRGKSVSDLLEAQGTYATLNKENLTPFAPTIGNATAPRSFGKALDEQKLFQVPMLMGGAREELRLYVGYWWQDDKLPRFTPAGFRDAWLPLFYPGNEPGTSDTIVSQIMEEYVPSGTFASDKAVAETFGTIISDYVPSIGINNCLYLQTAKRVSALAGAKSLYEYEFADPKAPALGVGITAPYPDFDMGTVHSSVLNYFFPKLSNTSKIDAPDLEAASQTLAKQLIEYWSTFARTGGPAASGQPAWAAYAGDGKAMTFVPGANGSMDARTRHHCAFWARMYPTTLQ